MTKECVITIRTALKGGKNLPLKIYSDNNFVIIDESLPAQFTKWDDENGVLYLFRLSSISQSRIPDNSEKAISVVALAYDFIQIIEIAPMPLRYFDDVIKTMEETGCTFNNQYFPEKIKDTFERLLDPNRVELSPYEINDMTGVPVRKGEDDYYHAKRFAESFKETRDHAINNKLIEDSKS